MRSTICVLLYLLHVPPGSVKPAVIGFRGGCFEFIGAFIDWQTDDPNGPVKIRACLSHQMRSIDRIISRVKEKSRKTFERPEVSPDAEGESVLASLRPGDIIGWNEVSEVHKIRNGIYHRGGRLVSLLTDFGKINPCYPDFHGSTNDIINYTGAGRRGDQKLDSYNRALLEAIESGHAVPLFNKLKVGRWEFLGYWKVTEGKYIWDENRERMVWKFTLCKSRKSGKRDFGS